MWRRFAPRRKLFMLNAGEPWRGAAMQERESLYMTATWRLNGPAKVTILQ